MNISDHPWKEPSNWRTKDRLITRSPTLSLGQPLTPGAALHRHGYVAVVFPVRMIRLLSSLIFGPTVPAVLFLTYTGACSCLTCLSEVVVRFSRHSR